MKKLILIAVIFLVVSNAEATGIPVIDISLIAHNIASQTVNYAQYIRQTLQQATLVANSVTQIENQVTGLARLGSPQYYVNMLGLSQFQASTSAMIGGVGQTIQQYRSIANGASALSYTGQGLYQNLSGMRDRFGNPILYNTQDFAKFATIEQMTEDYSTAQKTYDTQNASLLQQLQTALQQLNAETTQIGTEKRIAQINAIHAQILTLQSNSTLSGQRLQAQQIGNQNDAARQIEASRQMEIQERQTDLANEATQFGVLVGAFPPSGIMP
jgi:hypothetical protein